MNRIFDMEGPVFSFLSRLADLVWLNILYLICCIPVVTIGAATTAMYYVTLKMVKNEECYITKSFFRSFKQNFRQATIIWLIMALLGSILYLDYGIVSGRYGNAIAMKETMQKVFMCIFFAISVVYLFVMAYLFPLLAKFDNSIKNTLRNSLLISIKHLPFTVLLLLIPAAGLALIYFVPQLLILVFFLLFSLIALISSYIYVKIFVNYIPKEQDAE